MQTSKKGKEFGIPRKPVRRKKDSGVPQSSAGKTIIGTMQLQEPKSLPGFIGLQGNCHTQRFNTNLLKLSPKLGYEIFKNYGARVDFTINEKLHALLLYKCIRHLPNFVDKQFDNVNDAICYVFKEANRIINDRHVLLNEYGDAIQFNVFDRIQDNWQNTEAFLQIVFDEQNMQSAQWCTIKDVNTQPDKDLRKAIIKCIKLCMDMCFHFIDIQGGSDFVQSANDFYEFRLSDLEGELSYCYNKFQEENGRSFTSNDYETDLGSHIVVLLQQIEDLENEKEQSSNVVIPFFKEIVNSKTSIKFVKEQINRFEKTDIAKWMSHILYLKSIKFNINSFVGEAWRNNSDSFYDNDTLKGTSANCFIYDEDTEYIKSVNSDFNEYANNYSVLPFSNNMIISSKKGIIFKTKNLPIGEFVSKIFEFNFKTLQYEN